MSNKSYNIFKITILSVIAIVLIILTVFLLSGNINGLFFNFGEDYKLVSSFEYDVSEINKFSFNLINADLDVEYSNSDKIRVEIYDKSEDNFSVSLDNSVFKVNFSRYNSFCFGFCYVNRRVKLYLPEGYMGTLDIVSSSGDIYIGDFENVSGNVKTTSGEIKIVRVNEVVVKTTSGDIGVMSADSINASSTSGDINLSDISEVKFETTSGDVEVRNALNVVGKTISGEFEAYNVDGYIEFSGTSGDVDLENVTLNRNSSISTVSGDVEVRLNTSVNVKVNTVSGRSNIKNNDSDNNITLKISTTSGDIEVY